MPNIYVQAAAFRAAVVRRDAEAAARLTLAYDDILKSLQRELDAVVGRMREAHANGETITPYWLRREQRYKALLDQAERQLQFYASGTRQLVENRQIAELRHGIAEGTAMVETVSIGATFDRLPVSALENMVGVLRNESPLAQLLARDFAREGAEHIGRKLVEGVALGWNPRRIAALMRGNLKNEGNPLELPRTRALMISRTESLRAYRMASLQTYAASGVVVGWRRLCAKSKRTCLSCLSRDGEFHKLTDVFEEHPSGRCTPVPALETTPPPRQTGAEWFEAQSDATKREMMSTSAFELYKSGKIALRDFEGRRTSRKWGAMTYERSLREILERKKARA